MLLKLLNLWKSKAGNFAIATAILFPVLVMAAGSAVDYAIALKAGQDLKSAANAAALAAVTEAQLAYTKKEHIDVGKLLRRTGQEFFETEAVSVLFASIGKVDVIPAIEKNNISASIRYEATYPTYFMKLFGMTSISISNSARATMTVRTFINITFLVDVSQSMGIGATDADQKRVAEATGCAFACHINAARGSSPYDKARANGAQMRIDVARDAIMASLDAVKSASQFSGQVTFGLYKYDNELTEILSQKQQNSGDINFIKSRVRDQVKLSMVNGGTNLENALASLRNEIPASGSGLVENDRLQYLIVLTDGVESGQSWISTTGWRRYPNTVLNSPFKAYQPHEVNYAIDPDGCGRLREDKVGIYFIYTEYLEPKYGSFGDHDKERFSFVTKTLFPIIPKRFSECTGAEGHVLKANTPTEIQSQMVQLTKHLSTPLRLY
jgi:Flp pilus assembly protein TadG